MLTINYEIKKEEQRKDGTYNVKIRFTLNRKIKRVSTDISVTKKELNKDCTIKTNTEAFTQVAFLLYSYKEKYKQYNINEAYYTLDSIVSLLVDNKKKSNIIDFIDFSKRWIEKTDIKGKKNYKTALNSFIRFIGKDSFDIKGLTSKLLTKYTEFLDRKRKERVRKLIDNNERVTSNRTTSLYLGSLRHLYKEAQKEYNDYEFNVIPLPKSPFDWFSIPKQMATRKRALTVETIQDIYNLPYKPIIKGNKFCRYNLAKDCFILSFCLIGMNSADLYNVTEYEENYIKYYRTKTKDRRQDMARMEVKVPGIINRLMTKYKDLTGTKVFNFHQHYSSSMTFNIAINKGLKEIGAELGIEDLEFYAARHSWATIALNKAGVDKYTVHSALNHVDSSMSVTDIYIQRDFVIENEANRKVMEYIFRNLNGNSENLNGALSTCFIMYGMLNFAKQKRKA